MKRSYLILSALILFSACYQSKNKSDENFKFQFHSGEKEEDASALTDNFVPSEVDETIFNDLKGEQGKKVETEKSMVMQAFVPSIKIATKIRKTAFLNFNVDDYKKARIDIENIVRSNNAYIGSENEQNNSYSIYNTMVIRVMNKDFEAMVNNVEGVASYVNSKNITAEDVTAEFIDIQTRLKSKKEIEKRYLDILQKAAKVTDILEIERKLGEIREEIEAKEGELKYLADQVDYSTINLTFQQNFEYTPIDRPGFLGRSGNAFEGGWDGFLNFIVDLVYVWPLLLLLAIGAYFLMRFIKRKRKKKIAQRLP